MLSDLVRKRLKRRPFLPFRLEIAQGNPVEIRHPEMVILTRRSLVIGHDVRDCVAAYALEYSFMHITKLESLAGSEGT